MKGEIVCLEFREGGAGHSEPVKPPGPFPNLRHQGARDKWTNLNKPIASLMPQKSPARIFVKWSFQRLSHC